MENNNMYDLTKLGVDIAFSYNDGVLTRNDGRFAGKTVGTVCNNSVKTEYYGSRHKVHNLVWVLFNGIIPKGYIVTHINNNRFDNRITNLELITRRDNFKRKAKAKIKAIATADIIGTDRIEKVEADIQRLKEHINKVENMVITIGGYLEVGK